MPDHASRNEKLFERAMLIKEGRARGNWRPIIEALALRGDYHGMCELADLLSDDGSTPSRTANELYIRAYRTGNKDGRAAANLAATCFNRKNLIGYRHWLGKAARSDCYARSELKRFETRLPHQRAHEIGRGRPYRKSDFE